MEVTGGCYCGGLRYVAKGEPLAKAMCFCRECRHLAGGGANVILSMPLDGFSYTQGEPSQFARDDLENPVTRDFCGNCGTPILSRSPRMPKAVLIKAGSLDDQDAYGMPHAAVYCCEKQPYHVVPEGVAAFDTFPGR